MDDPKPAPAKVGETLRNAITHVAPLAIEIVKRSDTRYLVVLPRRWVIERTID